MKKYSSNDPAFLHHKAKELMQYTDQKNDLKAAKLWLEMAKNIDDNYYINETYALLLFRLDETKAAQKVANNALVMAKNQGINGKKMQNLLEQINNVFYN